jgi:hypothetical protein
MVSHMQGPLTFESLNAFVAARRYSRDCREYARPDVAKPDVAKPIFNSSQDFVSLALLSVSKDMFRRDEVSLSDRVPEGFVAFGIEQRLMFNG